VSVIVWIVEGTWPACADAARTHAPADTEVVLLHVRGDDVPAVAHGAFAGLLGRGGAEPDPARTLDGVGAAAGRDLLDAAARRLGRPCTRSERHGRAEREVVAAAEGADLLVMARDGDRDRLGPHSLGPAGRFVVDHAPCPVLLVWPESTPGLGTLPPPPHHPPPPPPPPPHHPPPPHP
jgi:nucleotide-binding universal stress UspA family protein